ncbi:MAG: hypothetical protein KDB27_07580 [Planctomycetales bacterium]|nr:hypothetical protein [Planctomycetales bacterium]
MLNRIALTLGLVILFNAELLSNEHFTVRLKSSKEWNNPTVATMLFSPDGSELAVATNRRLQFIRTADGEVTSRHEISPFSIVYSGDGSRFFAITTRKNHLLRTSDNASIPFTPRREPGYVGIRVGEKNGKLIISHLDQGSPAVESSEIRVGDELVGLCHGRGPHGETVNLVGRSATQATKEIKGLAGSYVRLKTIPKGSLDPRTILLRRRAADSIAGTRRWKEFAPETVSDHLARCIVGNYHELRPASTGNTVAAFRMGNIENDRGLGAISPDGQLFAWVGEYLSTPDEALRLRERTGIDNESIGGGGDGALVAGAAYDDLGFSSTKRYYGVEIYDVGSQDLRATFPIAVDPTWGGKVHRGVDFSSDSKQLIVGTGTRLHVYDIESGKRTNEILIEREPTIKSNYGQTVVKSTVAKGVAAVASYVGSVRLVDINTGKVLQVVSGRQTGRVTHVALSSDAKKLAFHLNGVVHVVHLQPSMAMSKFASD